MAWSNVPPNALLVAWHDMTMTQYSRRSPPLQQLRQLHHPDREETIIGETIM